VPFDQQYFENYAGELRPYDTYALDFTLDAAHAAKVFEWCHFLAPRKVIDLGAADGRVLIELEKHFPSIQSSEGIELSDWILEKKKHPGVRKGDVLKELSAHTLKDFDLVYINMLMYLDENSVEEVLCLLPSIGHENTVFVFSFNFDLTPEDTSKFSGNIFSVLTNDPQPVLARPKVWWLERIFRNFHVCADDGYIYATRHTFPTQSFSQAEDCRIYYPRHNPRWKGKMAPVTINWRKSFDFSFELSPDDESPIWSEFWRSSEPPLKAFEDVSTLFRSGALGPFYSVCFLPVKKYGYIPGLFLEDEDDSSWTPVTDYYIG
jgi:hypothetical protein